MNVAEIGPDKGRILFTAPWDPVVVRRGDALGLRALADQFAEALAPELSNRVRDGRWITILSWALVRSQQVFHAGGGRCVLSRAEQAARYAWLRPLELMWVARTIALAKKDWGTRPLAGQRRVKQWYIDDNRSTDRLGMSTDQFRAYRQNGMYGGYRVAFRKWPGMTQLGDGWTPGPATIRLAKWLDAKLGSSRPLWPIQADSDDDALPARSVKVTPRGQEQSWWLRHWKTFDLESASAEKNTLPRPYGELSPLAESILLRPLIFGDDQHGKRRSRVAREAVKCAARDHAELCVRLAEVFSSDRKISLLPVFSRLADAGMAAMDLVNGELQKDPNVAIADIASLSSTKSICDEMVAAAKQWRKHSDNQIRHIEAANRFAEDMEGRHRPIDCLRALLQYHELHGGGLRWFVLRDGKVEPRTPPRSGANGYRFRLSALCRLAVQCGETSRMPAALQREDVYELAEGTEYGNE